MTDGRARANQLWHAERLLSRVARAENARACRAALDEYERTCARASVEHKWVPVPVPRHEYSARTVSAEYAAYRRVRSVATAKYERTCAAALLAGLRATYSGPAPVPTQESPMQTIPSASEKVLAALATAPPEGMTLAELRAALPDITGESTIGSRLMKLRVAGRVEVRGVATDAHGWRCRYGLVGAPPLRRNPAEALARLHAAVGDSMRDFDPVAALAELRADDERAHWPPPSATMPTPPAGIIWRTSPSSPAWRWVREGARRDAAEMHSDEAPTFESSPVSHEVPAASLLDCARSLAVDRDAMIGALAAERARLVQEMAEVDSALAALGGAA